MGIWWWWANNDDEFFDDDDSVAGCNGSLVLVVVAYQLNKFMVVVCLGDAMYACMYLPNLSKELHQIFKERGYARSQNHEVWLSIFYAQLLQPILGLLDNI